MPSPMTTPKAHSCTGRVGQPGSASCSLRLEAAVSEGHPRAPLPPRLSSTRPGGPQVPTSLPLEPPGPPAPSGFLWSRAHPGQLNPPWGPTSACTLEAPSPPCQAPPAGQPHAASQWPRSSPAHPLPAGPHPSSHSCWARGGGGPAEGWLGDVPWAWQRAMATCHGHGLATRQGKRERGRVLPLDAPAACAGQHPAASAPVPGLTVPGRSSGLT